jgi:subtilisin-like proprotein convertase family protein
MNQYHFPCSDLVLALTSLFCLATSVASPPSSTDSPSSRSATDQNVTNSERVDDSHVIQLTPTTPTPIALPVGPRQDTIYFIDYAFDGPPVAIPDGSSSLTLEWMAPGTVPDDAIITSVSVYHNITHTNIGDLYAEIGRYISPSNWRTWTVRNHEGGSADNIDETRTAEDYYDGYDPDTIWHYYISDSVPSHSGTLNQVHLYVYYTLTPGVCGDGACDSSESACSCPTDCPPSCGDGCCTGNEDACSCPQDPCVPFCGDGCCNGDESCGNCPDCSPCCGDGACDAGENSCNCPADCTGPCCGDGTCESGESYCTCSVDCNPIGHTLHGVVYDDTNESGDFDLGEGLSGFKISFVGSTSATVTQADGVYCLEGLPSGFQNLIVTYNEAIYANRWLTIPTIGQSYDILIPYSQYAALIDCSAESVCYVEHVSMLPYVGAIFDVIAVAQGACSAAEAFESGDWVGGAFGTILTGVALVQAVVDTAGELTVFGAAATTATDVVQSELACGYALLNDQIIEQCGGWTHCLDAHLSNSSYNVFYAYSTTGQLRILDLQGNSLQISPIPWGDDESGPAVSNSLDAPGWIFSLSNGALLAVVLDSEGPYTVETSVAGANRNLGQSYALQIGRNDGVSFHESATFLDIPLTSQGIATITVDSSVAMPLAVDMDGDTVVDFFQSPVPPPLVVTAEAGHCVNSGGVVQLRASAYGGTPPYTFAWSPIDEEGQTQSTLITDTTEFTVIVTDALNSNAVASTTYTVAPQCPIYVSQSATGLNDGHDWDNAYKHLQDALAVSEPGDEIWVGRGVYHPDERNGLPDGGSGDQTLSFQLQNNVALRGGFAGYGFGNPNRRNSKSFESVLSGDLADNDGPGFTNRVDNSYNVLTAEGTDESAVLDGFTISGDTHRHGRTITVAVCTA